MQREPTPNSPVLVVTQSSWRVSGDSNSSSTTLSHSRSWSWEGLPTTSLAKLRCAGLGCTSAARMSVMVICTLTLPPRPAVRASVRGLGDGAVQHGQLRLRTCGLCLDIHIECHFERHHPLEAVVHLRACNGRHHLSTAAADSVHAPAGASPPKG